MRRQKRLAFAVIFVSLLVPAVAFAASGPVAATAPAARPAVIVDRAALARRAATLRLAHRRHTAAVVKTARLSRTRARLSGQRPHPTRHYRASLRSWSTPRLRAHARSLSKRIRVLRRTGGAPNVAIPPQLQAIAACESGGNPRAIGGGGAYRGLFQFDYGTWASVGGRGDPAAAPAEEQYRRAAMLYARSGSSPWPVCGR